MWRARRSFAVALLSFVIAVSPAVVARSSTASGGHVPRGVLTLDRVTVGVSTIEQAQRIYGKAERSRVSSGEEPDEAICCSAQSGDERLELIFETGIMGGYTDITGFRVRTGRPHANCTAITFDAKRFRTHNGVHLGQTSANFERVLRIKFKRRGSELRYEGEGRRVATAAELKELRGRWPNEAQSYIDVTTTIRARFVADRLVDFCVRKIESY